MCIRAGIQQVGVHTVEAQDARGFQAVSRWWSLFFALRRIPLITVAVFLNKGQRYE